MCIMRSHLMTQTTTQLISQAGQSRKQILREVSELSSGQSTFKSHSERWSITEVLEHLFLAEYSGVSKIWLAADGVRRGTPMWQGDHVNRGLSIEEVVKRTWKEKEAAPPIASPHFGGPLAFWVTSFESCQTVLERLGQVLDGLNLEDVISPHFLSGPLDARQRLEFLRFHMDRHLIQIGDIKAQSGFPKYSG